MRWNILASILAILRLLPETYAYGTTVSIAISYCPAQSQNTLASATSTSTLLPTPFVLSIASRLAKRASLQYLADGGAIKSDPRQSLSFTLTRVGELVSQGRYISTSGLVPDQLFAPSATKALISTRFSLSTNNSLEWTDIVFAGGQAFFCELNSLLYAFFDGEPPAGCQPTELTAIPLSQVNSPTSSFVQTASSTSSTIGTASTKSQSPAPALYSPVTVHGSRAVADPVGCFTPSDTAPVLTGEIRPVTSLEQCADLCFDSRYFGVQSGNQCLCANYLDRAANTVTFERCNIPCTGNANEMCGGTVAVAVYMIVSTYSSTTMTGISASASTSTSATISTYPAPASTGTPNCMDQSPFDGTVNGGYLILCDTELPGYDLASVPATDISDCIDACETYRPQDSGRCVAVEFDILAEDNSCHLKSNVSVIDRGNNAFAQAAIVVNQPYGPGISFINPTMQPTFPAPTTTSTTFSTTPASSTGSASSLTPTLIMSTTPNPPPASSTVPSLTVSNPSLTTTSTLLTGSTVASPISSTITTSSRNSVSSLSQSTRAQSSVITNNPTMLSSTPLPSIPNIQTTSTAVQSIPLTTAATTSRVVSFPPSAPTSSIPSTSSLASNSILSTSLSVSTSVLTAMSATSSNTLPISSPASSSTINTASSSIVLSSTTTANTCQATPTSNELCPNYNRQSINVNSDNVCYEVECNTLLIGTVMTDNSTTAISLKACISFCTLYNVAVPYGCVGVEFVTGNTLNCQLYSNITNNMLSMGVHGARLIYPGYPSATDPVRWEAPKSTTTSTGPSTARSSTLSSSITSTTLTNTNTISSATTTSSTTTSMRVSVSGTSTQVQITTATTSNRPVPIVSTSSSATVTSANPNPITTSTQPSTMPSSNPTSTPTPPTCPSATTDDCPATSSPPSCYRYDFDIPDRNASDWETECSTQFNGTILAQNYANSFSDCISFCDSANYVRNNTCFAMTYREDGVIGNNINPNNCLLYSTVTCAKRGNATFGSARLIYSGYPQMTDYDSSFLCST